MDVLQPCISCRRSLSRVGGRRQLRSYLLDETFFNVNPFVMNYLVEARGIRQFDNGTRLCRNCLRSAQRHIQRPALEPQQQPTDAAEPESRQDPEPEFQNDDVDEPRHEPEVPVLDLEVLQNIQQNLATSRVRFPLRRFSRAPFNTRRCIFASCDNTDVHRISRNLRITVLREKRFYIPLGARVCTEHRVEGPWHEIENSTRHVYTTFSPRQTEDMLNMAITPISALNFQLLSTIDDATFHYYTGLTKVQFREVKRTIPSLSHLRRPATSLAYLLVKLRTGEPNERLAKLFGTSRRQFEKTMKTVREYVLSEFVPIHMGYDHISREDMINRCLSIPKALFGNAGNALEERRAIVIFDGTYIYLQKSSNYYFQRKSYSLHKWRNLLKPFIMVCPDGHIIDIYGPYDAVTSDATILNNVLQSETDPFHWIYRPNDVFILDRGFRDSVEHLRSSGYIPKLPVTSSNQRQTQLTTHQANESRKVTLCRWVVETVNGRLKNQFKLLRFVANNRAMSHLFDEIKIAGAILNAFGRPLTDHRLVTEILASIEERSQLNENYLGDYITAHNMNARRAIFVSMTSENSALDRFPVLSKDDLIIYALGTYQLKQARSYYGEHIKNNGSYIIEVCSEINLENLSAFHISASSPWLLRGRIQSRHRQSKEYYVYILIEGDSQEGRNAILGHYCSCITGRRTLGTCAHVMSILWYLGWGRHQENLSPPALFLDSIIIRHDVENEVQEDTE